MIVYKGADLFWCPSLQATQEESAGKGIWGSALFMAGVCINKKQNLLFWTAKNMDVQQIAAEDYFFQGLFNVI